MDWLHDLTIRLAQDAGLESGDFSVDPASKGKLLKIARIAAHTSGDRTNAPLLCYVLGKMIDAGYDIDRAAAVIGDGE